MKSIVLHISNDNGMSARLQAALDVARAYDGHITCLQATHQFTPTAFAPIGGDLVAGLNFEDIEEAEKQLRSRLQEKLKGEDVSWDWKMGLDDPASLLIEQSGLADLLILSRAHGKRDNGSDPPPIAGDVVLHSNTACLLMPWDSKSLSVDAPVVVAWDGSAEAARAIRYALPVLQRASQVHLLMVEEEGRSFPDISASEYLSRHGVKSELHQLSDQKAKIAQILQNFAGEKDASIIVMGAYGHSRVRETLFGGVTKSMLDDCAVPLFVAH